MTAVMMEKETSLPKLKLIENDPWLEPFSAAIEGRHENTLKKEKELTKLKKFLQEIIELLSSMLLVLKARWKELLLLLLLI